MAVCSEKTQTLYCTQYETRSQWFSCSNYADHATSRVIFSRLDPSVSRYVTRYILSARPERITLRHALYSLGSTDRITLRHALYSLGSTRAYHATSRVIFSRLDPSVSRYVTRYILSARPDRITLRHALYSLGSTRAYHATSRVIFSWLDPSVSRYVTRYILSARPERITLRHALYSLGST